MKIGIDFGTCYSVIAVMQGLKPADNLAREYEEHLGGTNDVGIPSLFMYSEEEEEEKYGTSCQMVNWNDNPNVIKYMKKEVRLDPENLDKTYISGGREYLLRDVIQKYVAYLIKAAKDSVVSNPNFSDTNIEAITITTPIGIADNQMTATDYNRLIKEVMSNTTGLPDNKIHIIGEPVAAAISYFYEDDFKKHHDDEKTVLIFDLGGGTLDITIMKFDPRTTTYEVLDKEGDLELGGKDFDDALAKKLMEKYEITEFSDPKEKAAFKETITTLKISLSTLEQDVKLIKYNGDDMIIKCSREEFEEASADLITRATELVHKAVDSLDDGISSIDKIVLVGGSSNMPMIRDMFLNEFDSLIDDTITIYNPSRAIARGAALFTEFSSGSRDVPNSPKIIDSTSVSYGFAVLKDDENKIYYPILKGTKFDESGHIHAKSSSFTALTNEQTSISYIIYEGQWTGGNRIASDSENSNKDLIDDEARFADPFGDEVANGMTIDVQIPPEFIHRATMFSTFAKFDLGQDGILDVTIVDENDKKIGYSTNEN